MKLNKKVITRLREDYTLRSKIGILTGKHPMTVQLWVNKNINHGPLTTWAVLVFLAEELNMKINELVVDEKPVIPINTIR